MVLRVTYGGEWPPEAHSPESTSNDAAGDSNADADLVVRGVVVKVVPDVLLERLGRAAGHLRNNVGAADKRSVTAVVVSLDVAAASASEVDALHAARAAAADRLRWAAASPEDGAAGLLLTLLVPARLLAQLRAQDDTADAVVSPGDAVEAVLDAARAPCAHALRVVANAPRAKLGSQHGATSLYASSNVAVDVDAGFGSNIMKAKASMKDAPEAPAGDGDVHDDEWD
ncbi:hypothetical protein M885DRAFT_504579 [Pelagophyceae sp. CCMP2097]|nr:hypothetical protein M885DRAFT_504579 [Pelagophyceae sp. CCMP2097]